MKYRKNNESINKYTAGYFDGNGTIYVRKAKEGLRLTMELCFRLDYPKAEKAMLDLFDHYRLGRIDRKTTKNEIPMGYWVIEGQQALSLFNQIKKHCVIKGQHGERVIKLYTRRQELKGRNYEVIKRYLRISRKNTGPIRPKNHLTWGWLAGYIDADAHIDYKPGNRYIRFGGSIEKDMAAALLISKSLGREFRECDDGCWRMDLFFASCDKSFAKNVLCKLVIHLKIKRWQAEQLLSLYSSTCNE